MRCSLPAIGNITVLITAPHHGISHQHARDTPPRDSFLQVETRVSGWQTVAGIFHFTLTDPWREDNCENFECVVFAQTGVSKRFVTDYQIRVVMAAVGFSTDPLPLRRRLLAPAVVIPGLHFLSGLSNSLVGTAYRLLQIEDAQLEPQMQSTINGVVAQMPWDFKILAAFLSDWMPICGRRRLPYLVIAIFVEAVEKFLLGTLAPTVGWLMTDAFIASSAQVFIGVMLDTLSVSYTRIESAADLGTMQTNRWAALRAGELVGGLCGSLLMDVVGFSRRSIFLTSSALKVVMLAAAFAVDDPRVDAADADGACGGLCARAGMLLSELSAAMRRKRVWMPALFIWIWWTHPGSGDAFDSFLLQTPNASHPNAIGPQPLGFSPTQYSLQARCASASARLQLATCGVSTAYSPHARLWLCTLIARPNCVCVCACVPQPRHHRRAARCIGVQAMPAWAAPTAPLRDIHHPWRRNLVAPDRACCWPHHRSQRGAPLRYGRCDRPPVRALSSLLPSPSKPFQALPWPSMAFHDLP